MKQILATAACAIGVHDWGWTYLTAGDCAQERVCARCGVSNSRVAHDWSDWYYATQRSCKLTRECRRCGALASRKKPEHIWGDWEGYVIASAEECANQRHCTRCGQRDLDDARRHDWDLPYYRMDSSCDLLCACIHCGAVANAGVADHEWGSYSYRYGADSCEVQRFCERCAVREERATPKFQHRWGVWQHASPLSCQQVRFCLRCHSREQGDVAHRWNKWHYDAEDDMWVRECQHCGEEERQETID